MTNTVNDQPLYASLQLTDYLLAWQGAQSPPTRKVTVSGLSAYYLSLSGGGSISGNLTLSSGNLTVSSGTTSLHGATTVTTGGLTVTGNSSVTGSLTVSVAGTTGNQVVNVSQFGSTGSFSGGTITHPGGIKEQFIVVSTDSAGNWTATLTAMTNVLDYTICAGVFNPASAYAIAVTSVSGNVMSGFATYASGGHVGAHETVRIHAWGT